MCSAVGHGAAPACLLLDGPGLVAAGATGAAPSPRGRRLLGWTGPDGVVPSAGPAPVQPMPWGAWTGLSGPVVLVLPRFLNGCGFRSKPPWAHR
ncbi:hypothetical protein [Lentzea sp. CC55]|uniref:hypothetical protein n=1 Tax=Lentzea sp. CC55 TaxID=2884909 RepID=UPI001F306953|nr:hypothetical protein [Lentzea sp. CC55]MCG8922758.1 hypothetical protein [Lentzea sp. CC55]